MQTYILTVAAFCNLLINREVYIYLRNVATGVIVASGKAAEIEFSKYATSPIAFIDVDCDSIFHDVYILTEEAE